MPDKDYDKSGGPAFPTLLTGKWAGTGSDAVFAPDMSDGMSLRAHFAGLAMAGLLGNAEWGCRTIPIDTAHLAVDLADALIAALKESKS